MCILLRAARIVTPLATGPASANPLNTTFPVMLATNTRPSRKMLTVSTTPVTNGQREQQWQEGPLGLPAGPGRGPLACHLLSINWSRSAIRRGFRGNVVAVR